VDPSKWTSEVSVYHLQVIHSSLKVPFSTFSLDKVLPHTIRMAWSKKSFSPFLGAHTWPWQHSAQNRAAVLMNC